jgi:hypothetical protein
MAWLVSLAPGDLDLIFIFELGGRMPHPSSQPGP